MIPFSRDVFLGQIAELNALLWPGQIAILLLALGILALAARPVFQIERLPALCLSAAWISVGTLYYGLQFTPLNWAAWLAAALFVLQGLLLLWFGVVQNRLRLRFKGEAPSWVGAILLAAATFGYPLLGLATGTGIDAAPIVGIDPGPTVLFTWGYLLLTAEKTYRLMLPLPFIAAWVCAVAGWLIGVPADVVLAPAAIGALFVIVKLKRCAPRKPWRHAPA